MMEKARCGTKRVVVEMELAKEKYNKRGETGAFSELKTSLALPKAGYANACEGEVGWGKKVRNQPARRQKREAAQPFLSGPGRRDRRRTALPT
jgi:hypothetical protein